MQVILLDHMGSDLSVVNAARVSFDKQSGWLNGFDELQEKDAKLIRYLAKHNHWTPFGHCFASFRVKAPIFVARQLGKHQVGLVWNEVSRRYVDSDPEFYIPSEWRGRADNVKQGSSDEVVNLQPLEVWEWSGYGADWGYEETTQWCLNFYNYLLSQNVCPEQARMVLPQSMYTEWVWSGSLAAFARVCKLRLDPHTQRETASVAAKIYDELEKLFPVSWAALMEDSR